MTYSTLAWQIDDRVLTLTLNRPAQLNAFTVTMADELIDACTRASADDAVGAVVVTGAGRASDGLPGCYPGGERPTS